MIDIGSFFSEFFGYFSGLILSCFSFLDSISISGVSLLDFFIALLIISALLPIVLSLVSSGYSSSRSYYRHQRFRSEQAENRRAWTEAQNANREKWEKVFNQRRSGRR